MSDKNDKKKTKEEFTSFLLGDEGITSVKTTVLNSDKKNSDIPEAPPAPKNTSDTAKIETPDTQKIKVESVTKETASTEKSQEKSKSKPILASVKKEFDKPEKSVSVFNRDNLDPSLFSLEAALKQSEYLRIAQGKVKELEKRLETVTKENETLSASALVLQKKCDQLAHQLDALKQDQKAKAELYKDEIVLKDKIVRAIEKEKEDLKRKNDEMSAITNEKIQQIRLREKELQNRLEILQHEGDVIITNKDETILDLKKEIDQLNYEIENYKVQSRELNKELQDQKEQMRRSIKALRLALNLLENDELDANELKKTGT